MRNSMSIATTPSQIKDQCSGIPTRGTILILGPKGSEFSFIVAMDQIRAIKLLQKLITTYKAWNPEILRQIISKTPTCPVPKNPVKELSDIIKMGYNSNQLTWTTDSWETESSCTFDYIKKVWLHKLD